MFTFTNSIPGNLTTKLIFFYEILGFCLGEVFIENTFFYMKTNNTIFRLRIFMILPIISFNLNIFITHFAKPT